MIIGRRYSTFIDPLLIARSDRILRIIERLGKIEPIEYTDDILHKIRIAIKRNRLYPLDEGLKTFVAYKAAISEDINRNIERISDTLDYIFLAMESLPGYINALSQNVELVTSNSTEKIKKLQNILFNVESEGKKRRTITSIKDEKRFVTSFLDEKDIASSSLDIDSTNGTVTLLKVERNLVKYRIVNVTVNNINKLIIGSNVSIPLIDGYYFGNFYDTRNPVFESKTFIDRNDSIPTEEELSALQDGDRESIFQIEHITDNDNQALSVNIDIELLEDAFDMITISTHNFGTDKWIRLNGAKINDIDVTNNIIGSGIKIKSDVLVEPDTFIIPGKSNPFPTSNFYIEGNSRFVQLNFVQDSFYKTRIRKSRYVTDNGIVVRDYNYLETFILENRTVNPLKFNPYLLEYNKDELNNEYGKNARYEFYNEIRNRYAIGLSNLEFFRYKYFVSGSLTTNRFTVPGNVISIDLYTDEQIFENTDIIFTIITDDQEEFIIYPFNRVTNNTPKRLVFDPNFILEEGDIFIDKVIDSFVVRIDMNGQTDVSPLLRSMVIRTKVGEL